MVLKSGMWLRMENLRCSHVEECDAHSRVPIDASLGQKVPPMSVDTLMATQICTKLGSPEKA